MVFHVEHHPALEEAIQCVLKATKSVLELKYAPGYTPSASDLNAFVHLEKKLVDACDTVTYVHHYFIQGNRGHAPLKESR